MFSVAVGDGICSQVSGWSQIWARPANGYTSIAARQIAAIWLENTGNLGQFLHRNFIVTGW